MSSRRIWRRNRTTALGMYRDEVVREIYSRTDGKGAVLVLECADEAEGRETGGRIAVG